MATLQQTLRRVYSDIVRRRAHVRVTPSVEPTLTAVPIFVTGVYRSGTTLLRYVLDTHSSIACPPESEFLTHLDRMIEHARSREGLLSLGFDDEHVIGRMRSFAAYFFEGYARSRSKARWADKTPRYVDHLDFLVRLFPTAQFVMIHRHPLDQVASAVRRSTIPPEDLAAAAPAGADEFVAASHYWADKTAGLVDFAQRRPAACHSVRYEDLCADPEGVLRAVFEFLEEPWEPEVLRFYAADHDVGREDGRVGATRSFEARSGRYRPWPAARQQECWEIVAPVAEPLGYRLRAEP